MTQEILFRIQSKEILVDMYINSSKWDSSNSLNFPHFLFHLFSFCWIIAHTAQHFISPFQTRNKRDILTSYPTPAISPIFYLPSGTNSSKEFLSTLKSTTNKPPISYSKLLLSKSHTQLQLNSMVKSQLSSSDILDSLCLVSRASHFLGFLPTSSADFLVIFLISSAS